jgi:hypothetical protein
MSAQDAPRQGDGPDMVAGIPQATDLPRPAPGPEPMSLPESPSSGGGQEDWKALWEVERGRRQGLDNRNASLQEERDRLVDKVDELQKALANLTKPKPEPKKVSEPEPEPVSSGNQDAVEAGGELRALLQQMQGDLAQLRAAQHRDSLLREYMSPGKPGEGLDLYAYGDYIPVHPAEVDESGKVDDSAQRKVIEGLIERLRAERGQAAKATERDMEAGSTPGSAPSTGAPASSPTGWEEYQRLKAEVNDMSAMEKLSAAERKAKMDRYYKLVGEFGHRDAGFKQPWVSGNDMYRMINDLTAKVTQLGGK